MKRFRTGSIRVRVNWGDKVLSREVVAQILGDWAIHPILVRALPDVEARHTVTHAPSGRVVYHHRSLFCARRGARALDQAFPQGTAVEVILEAGRDLVRLLACGRDPDPAALRKLGLVHELEVRPDQNGDASNPYSD